jgi:hypothetical protein
MKEGTLSYAVLLAIETEPHVTAKEISVHLDEPDNLVSGTIKYLLNREYIDRVKRDGVYRYFVKQKSKGIFIVGKRDEPELL